MLAFDSFGTGFDISWWKMASITAMATLPGHFDCIAKRSFHRCCRFLIYVIYVWQVMVVEVERNGECECCMPNEYRGVGEEQIACGLARGPIPGDTEVNWSGRRWWQRVGIRWYKH